MLKVKKNPLKEILSHLNSDERKAWERYEATMRAFMMMDRIRLEAHRSMEAAQSPKEKAKFAQRRELLICEVLPSLGKRHDRAYDKAAAIMPDEVFQCLFKGHFPKWKNEIHGGDGQAKAPKKLKFTIKKQPASDAVTAH